MTNKEAITHLKSIRNLALGEVMKEALTKAIEALEIVDDVNHKIYRNKNCPQKNKCYDYQGYHCAGCSWEVKNDG